jgi:hypothetical protein
MGTEQERDKAEAPKADKTTESGGSAAGAGVRAVDALLQKGGRRSAGGRVVTILEHFPADRDAIYGRLQQTVGNQYVQYVQQVAAANPKPTTLPPRDLDSGLAAGRRATQILDVARSTLFPAYRRAVDAVDPIASLELARNVVGSIQVAEDGKREVVATLGGNDPHHFMTSAPDKPDDSEAVVMSKWGELEMLQARLLTELEGYEAVTPL